MELFDKDGNKVEAFSQEDLDARIAEATQKAKDDFGTDITAKLESFQAELDKRDAKIKELEESEMSEGQKQRLKKKAEEAGEKLSEMEERMMEKFSSLETQLNQNKQSSIQSMIKEAADGDDAMAEKIIAELAFIGGEGLDDAQRVAKAVALAQASQPKPGALDGVDMGARGEGTPQGGDGESEGSKEVRKLLGISDQDAAKFNK